MKPSSMDRRGFLGTVGAGCLGLSLFPRRRPNLLFIICDDLNDAVSGFGGHPQARTPHLDRLAKRGVRFTNAQNSSPICGPSRASLLTGLYPHTSGYIRYRFHRAHWRRNPVLKDSVTFLEHFREHGYRVMGTGKIHHNHQEEWHVWDAFGIRPSWGPWPWDGSSDLSFNHGQPAAWGNATVHPDIAGQYGIGDIFGPLSNVPDVPPDPEKGTPGYRGWRLFHQPFHYGDEEDRDRMPDELNALWAKKQLEQPQDRPFLLCVGMNRPHEPMTAPKKYFDRFPLEQVELAPVKEDDLDDCARVLTQEPAQAALVGHRRFAHYIETGGTEMWRRWTQAYLANVAFVDDQIGVILDALENGPHRDNTYVFFTSDHGYHMGEKLYIAKNSVWEESCRVPFLVAGPGVREGAECDHPISLVDLYPTFLDLCRLRGEPNRDTNGQPLDGCSIRPFLEDPANGRWDGPDAALTAVTCLDRLPVDERSRVERQHYSLRTKKYRYVRCNNGEEELYDHDADPYEWRNLASDPECEEVRRELYERLMRMLAGG